MVDVVVAIESDIALDAGDVEDAIVVVEVFVVNFCTHVDCEEISLLLATDGNDVVSEL